MKTVYDRMMENDSYQKTKDFIIKQKWPYPQKKAYAEKIAWEFYQHPDVAGRCYVTVGGLDSITLFLFLRSIGINVPAVSVSSLEDKSIQLVHKALGIRSLPPIKDENGRPYTKMRVIQQYGYPVISKEAAQKISHLQNPTSKNATVRHAIMTGETGEYGGFKKNSRMKMSQKWLEKFGGPENENEGTNYQTAPFKVSDACCYYLKERPCDLYAKIQSVSPIWGSWPPRVAAVKNLSCGTGATMSAKRQSGAVPLPFSAARTSSQWPWKWTPTTTPTGKNLSQSPLTLTPVP